MPALESSTSGISWSPTGYHLDRLAFYIVADTLRLYSGCATVKVNPARNAVDAPYARVD